jgi:death on curing protein
VVDAIHLDQLREHGGRPGIRDQNLLESALARPQFKWTCGEVRDLATLAAAYGFGLIRNHPYLDGNKRIGFLASVTFLGINGHDLETTDSDVVGEILGVAAGKVSEETFAAWIRDRMAEAS